MKTQTKQALAPGTYRHYKGDLYRVIGTGKHSETLEDLVFYQALYDNPKSKLWIRPLKMFLENVDVDGEMQPRFQHVGEQAKRPRGNTTLKIGIIGSMQYTEKMLEVRDQLKTLDHEAFVTDLHQPFIGKSDEEKERIKINQKNNHDAIREFWRLMQGADAVLVLNLDKHDVKHYIGGNTFLEMGFAHVLNQKIFLFNPIPDMPYYKTEIEAMRPVVINQDLTAIF